MVRGPGIWLTLDASTAPSPDGCRDEWCRVQQAGNPGNSNALRVVVLTGSFNLIPLTHDQRQWIAGLLPEVEQWCSFWEYFHFGRVHDWTATEACLPG
jgi:hypothetical protein